MDTKTYKKVVWGRWVIGVLAGTLLSVTIATSIARDQFVEGCERGKLDRASQAEAFRAQSDYLNLVLDAKSVKQDVKDAALMNQKTQNASATDLESRTGNGFKCADKFPGLFDLVFS